MSEEEKAQTPPGGAEDKKQPKASRTKKKKGGQKKEKAEPEVFIVLADSGEGGVGEYTRATKDELAHAVERMSEDYEGSVEIYRLGRRVAFRTNIEIIDTEEEQ